jgi:phage terminase small subunit
MAGTGRKPFETTEIAPFGVESRRLRPPDCLGELQQRAFLDLVTSCPVNQFRRSDLSLLCRWAELTVMAETAAFHLGADGMVIETKEGSKVSPWFAVHRDCTRELRSLSQRLQIGPRGRTWKAPKVKPGTVSYYERMQLEGQLDDAEPS